MRTLENRDTLRVGFVGAGSIAESILGGIIKNEILSPAQIYVTNHQNDQRLLYLQQRYGVSPTRDLETMVKDSTMLLLAIKPKEAKEVCLRLGKYIRRDQLIVSVMAGISTKNINEWLGVDCPIIRTMPNTSSSVGLSATGIAAGRYASESHLEIAAQLFRAIGSVFQVAEADLHILTGLSGSGPAFIYYMAEAMEQAGVKAGLPADLSRELTVQTLLGAAHMLLKAEEEPAELRRKITSPGGTTEAGLAVLNSYSFQQAMIDAILRAAEKSEELGKLYR
ncbi:pyrroline-5-carboxylate reductase [Brevibacillus fulvus]|uniref:Pyrroline-5-carboxylate reductase n=1 Tax=Brevibacillus fulvus TaxID=1125967 RepID=A0A938XZF7_9BACL|nr:pyrroline-5-carboxylate reductase [Brevibacillus fulvus]MBM7591054.1 pyrroline-5-carboxylate reductase [Brevibacillus fulvus]